MDAEWAQQKGLYTAIYEDVDAMDQAIEELCGKLVKSNPEAMSLLKKVFWEGTEHWDQLLEERAAMSGKLVLSDFTRNAISAFKAK
jgi:methylglutaconyl-CoA hydratase